MTVGGLFDRFAAEDALRALSRLQSHLLISGALAREAVPRPEKGLASEGVSLGGTLRSDLLNSAVLSRETGPANRAFCG